MEISHDVYRIIDQNRSPTIIRKELCLLLTGQDTKQETNEDALT